jgi:hypothetical protein
MSTTENTRREFLQAGLAGSAAIALTGDIMGQDNSTGLAGRSAGPGSRSPSSASAGGTSGT